MCDGNSVAHKRSSVFFCHRKKRLQNYLDAELVDAYVFHCSKHIHEKLKKRFGIPAGSTAEAAHQPESTLSDMITYEKIKGMFETLAHTGSMCQFYHVWSAARPYLRAYFRREVVMFNTWSLAHVRVAIYGCIISGNSESFSTLLGDDMSVLPPQRLLRHIWENLL